MVTNVSIASIFPSVSSVLIVLVVGTFNAASGVFLIFKLLADQYTLKEMFTVLLIGSVVVHLRTFLLMPYRFVPKNVENYSIFRESFVGRLLTKKSSVDGEKEEEPVEEVKVEVPTDDTNTIPSLIDCLKTPLFWQFLIFFNVMSVRVKTMQGKAEIFITR